MATRGIKAAARVLAAVFVAAAAVLVPSARWTPAAFAAEARLQPGVTIGAVTAGAPEYEVGLNFTTQQAGWITQLAWYRAEAGTTQKQNRTVRLWAGGQYVAGCVTEAGDTTGFRWCTLSTPVEVATGTTYTVTYSFGPTGETRLTHRTDYPAAAQAPLVRGSGVYGTVAGNFPTTAGNNYGLDVLFTDALVVPTPTPTTAPARCNVAASVWTNAATQSSVTLPFGITASQVSEAHYKALAGSSTDPITVRLTVDVTRSAAKSGTGDGDTELRSGVNNTALLWNQLTGSTLLEPSVDPPVSTHTETVYVRNVQTAASWGLITSANVAATITAAAYSYDNELCAGWPAPLSSATPTPTPAATSTPTPTPDPVATATPTPTSSSTNPTPTPTPDASIPPECVTSLPAGKSWKQWGQGLDVWTKAEWSSSTQKRHAGVGLPVGEGFCIRTERLLGPGETAYFIDIAGSGISGHMTWHQTVRVVTQGSVTAPVDYFGLMAECKSALCTNDATEVQIAWKLWTTNATPPTSGRCQVNYPSAWVSAGDQERQLWQWAILGVGTQHIFNQAQDQPGTFPWRLVGEDASGAQTVLATGEGRDASGSGYTVAVPVTTAYVRLRYYHGGPGQVTNYVHQAVWCPDGAPTPTPPPLVSATPTPGTGQPPPAPPPTTIDGVRCENVVMQLGDCIQAALLTGFAPKQGLGGRLDGLKATAMGKEPFAGVVTTAALPASVWTFIGGDYLRLCLPMLEAELAAQGIALTRPCVQFDAATSVYGFQPFVVTRAIVLLLIAWLWWSYVRAKYRELTGGGE